MLFGRACHVRDKLIRDDIQFQQSHDTLVESPPTLITQQAKHIAWAEQRELFELQKMVMHELQQAMHVSDANHCVQPAASTKVYWFP